MGWTSGMWGDAAKTAPAFRCSPFTVTDDAIPVKPTLPVATHAEGCAWFIDVTSKFRSG